MALPSTDAPVNDHAGVLSAATLARLDHRLADTPLVVVTLPTTSGQPIERLAERLAAGRPLVLLAIDDQRLCVHGLAPPSAPDLAPPIRAALAAADYDRAVIALVDAALRGIPPPIASW